MAKIYTRKGDSGTCQLIGGQRIPKNDPRVECYGTYDELCSLIGSLRVELPDDHQKAQQLEILQKTLMQLMAALATPLDTKNKSKMISLEDTTQTVETWIDEMEKGLPGPLRYFILPGGCRTSALCQQIRALARTAERRMVAIDSTPNYLAFANRISDYFFVFARYELHRNNIDETNWKWLPTNEKSRLVE